MAKRVSHHPSAAAARVAHAATLLEGGGPATCPGSIDGRLRSVSPSPQRGAPAHPDHAVLPLGGMGNVSWVAAVGTEKRKRARSPPGILG